MSSAITDHDAARAKINSLALGTLANTAINRQLNTPRTRLVDPSARDTYTDVVAEDAHAAARVIAAPRFLLNHLFGGGTIMTGEKPVPSLREPKKDPSLRERLVQAEIKRYNDGLLSDTLQWVAHSAGLVGGALTGAVGTALGAAGGLVLPLFTGLTAEECVHNTADAFEKAGYWLVKAPLQLAAWVISEGFALASAVVTGVLAGAGMLLGGLWGAVPHGLYHAACGGVRDEAAEGVVRSEHVDTVNVRRRAWDQDTPASKRPVAPAEQRSESETEIEEVHTRGASALGGSERVTRVTETETETQVPLTNLVPPPTETKGARPLAGM